LELGAKAGCDEASVQQLERSKNTRASSATAHRRDQNAVAVVVVQHKDVVVAGTRGDNETAGLVCMDLAGGGFDDSREAMMGTLVEMVAGRELEGSFGGDIGGR
jgi:hypothetical protein